MCVLAFLVYGFIPQIKIIMQGKFHIIFGVFASVATLVTSLPIFNQQPLLSYIIVVLIGISLPWFLISWLHLLVRKNAIQIIASFIIAGLIAAGLFFGITSASPFATCLAALFSIVTSSIFLSTRAIENTLQKNRSEAQESIVVSAHRIGGIALLAVFSLGFFTQFLSIVSLVPLQVREGTAEGDAAVACLAASIILFLGLAVYRFKKSNQLDALEASLSFCIILIALTIFSAGYSGNDSNFSLIFSICTRLSFLVVLIVLLITASRGNVRPRPILCLGLAVLYSGYFIGGLLGEMQLSSRDITSSVLISLSLLLVASMLILVRRMDAIRNYPSAPNSNSSSRKSAFVDYRTFAESQGLTPRQTEVLGCLATGRSSAYIAKQLNISENTAKAHVSKIYEKLNVHSRDELLDLLEHSDISAHK